MVLPRRTRLLVCLALAAGLGLVLPASASAAPDLSPGCANLHAMEPDQQLASSDITLTAASYAAGEILRVESVADGMDTGPFVTISSPDRPDAHLSGSVGDVMTYAFPVDGSYTIDIVSRYQPAITTVKLGCGLPATPTATMPAGDVYVGQHVEVPVSCVPGTNPLASCTDSSGALDEACRETGCSRTLDTTVPGSHLLEVTAVDSRGLVRTRQFWYSVVRRSQSLSWTTTPPEGVDWFFGDVDFGFGYVAHATATSGLPVSYSVDPASAGVCRIAAILDDSSPFGSGAALEYLGAGTCTIHADQAGNDAYLPATRVSQSFVIDRVVSFLTPAKAVKGVLGLTPTRFSATLGVPEEFGPGWTTRGYPGQTIVFSVAGRTACSAVTDANGVAACSAPIGLAAAITQSSYTATYGGDQGYLGATAKGKFGG